MIKILFSLILSTLFAFGVEKHIPALPFVVGFMIVVGLFFWGVYKAVKTQKTIYTLAMLPFVLLMVVMFFI